MSYQCSYCGNVFAYKTGQYRHMKDRCLNKPIESHGGHIEIVDKTTTTQTRKITIKLKNNNHMNVDQKKGTDLEDKRNSEIDKQRIVNNDNDSEIVTLLKEIQKEHQEEICLLRKELQELKNNPTTLVQNNTLVQVKQIVCFDTKMIDIYNKKKELHGDNNALCYVYNLVNGKNPNNKHDWIRDHEIIDPSKNEHPLKWISEKKNGKLQIKVRVDPEKTIIDDGTHIDKIGNDIVTNSVLLAHNDFIDKARKKSNFEYPDSLSDSIGNPYIYEKQGHSIFDLLFKFRKIKPSAKHLSCISNIELLDELN